jgi:hypothetical protein
MKEFAAGLCDPSQQTKTKNPCKRGVVAKQLIGSKFDHVLIRPDGEFTFAAYLQKHLTEFVLFKAFKRKTADVVGEQLDWYECTLSAFFTCYQFINIICTPHVPSLGILRSSYYNAFKLSVV